MVICPICGYKYDYFDFCETCEKRFHSRCPANKMLKSERMREAKFISDHMDKDTWPIDLDWKWQRLRELAGRSLECRTHQQYVEHIEQQDRSKSIPIYIEPKHDSWPVKVVTKQKQLVLGGDIDREPDFILPTLGNAPDTGWLDTPILSANDDDDDVPF